MCYCHSILERCVMFSGVKLSVRPFNLFITVSESNFQLEYFLTLVLR